MPPTKQKSAKKPLKKPSVKPRKTISKSTIPKPSVNQVVNIHLPSKSRTYRRSSDGKTVTKTIVQPTTSMVQPIYIPQPNPYNFNDSNISSSLMKLLTQIQTKPHLEVKEEPIKNQLEEFRNVDIKDKNENFLNQLENKTILDKVNEPSQPIESNEDEITDVIKLRKPVDNRLFDIAKKYQQRNKMNETLDEMKRNNEANMMGQEDINVFEEPQKMSKEDIKKEKKAYKKLEEAYKIYESSGGQKTLQDLRSESINRPENMTQQEYILNEAEKLLIGNKESVKTKKKTGRPKKNKNIEV